MTDRELLEAAAKAAGISIDKSAANGGGVDNTGFDMAGNAVLDWRNGKTWNPLSDDGDALRLAAHLRFDIHYETQFVGNEMIEVVEIWYDRDPLEGSCKCEMLSLDADPASATRRAIVRAAAIGRSYEGEGK